MPCWQKTIETLKESAITKQLNQPWNGLSTTYAWSEFKFWTLIHLEHYPKCYSDDVKKEPLRLCVCRPGCEPSTQHPGWLQLWHLLEYFLPNSSGICLKVSKCVLSPKEYLIFLSKERLSIIICLLVLLVYYGRESGDTCECTLSVMCNQVDASLVRGWCLTLFFFEPTANWRMLILL